MAFKFIERFLAS